MKFDLRFPIGILFGLYGVLLLIWGAATHADAARYEASLGININLWCGLILLVFGGLMLLAALRARGKAPPTEKP